MKTFVSLLISQALIISSNGGSHAEWLLSSCSFSEMDEVIDLLKMVNSKLDSWEFKPTDRTSDLLPKAKTTVKSTLLTCSPPSLSGH